MQSSAVYVFYVFHVYSFIFILRPENCRHVSFLSDQLQEAIRQPTRLRVALKVRITKRSESESNKYMALKLVLINQLTSKQIMKL